MCEHVCIGQGERVRNLRTAEKELRDENRELRAEVERLTAENEAMVQKTCDVCDGDGWVYNRVEGRGACVCMIEAEPFQILQTALETIGKAATGDIQIADDDTGGMRWIAGKAEEALHSVLPLDYEAPV